MCVSCEQLRINGVVTHEIGCPDFWKDQIRDCKFCGQPFRPETRHQDCCDDSCNAAYHGWCEVEA
jgi:hypothetical protein